MIKIINSKLLVSRKFLEKHYSSEMIRKNISLGKFIASEDTSFIEYQSVLDTNNRVSRISAKKDLPSYQSLLSKAKTEKTKKEVAQKYEQKEQENIYISLIKGFYKPNRELFFASEYGSEFAYDFTRASAWLDFLLEAKSNKSLFKQTQSSSYAELIQNSLEEIQKENLRGLKVNTAASLQNKKLFQYRKAYEKDKTNYWKTVADSRMKISNQNAFKAKLNKESNFQTFHFATLVGLFANYDNPQILTATGITSIYANYEEICKEYGVKPLSESSVKRFPQRSDAINRIMRSRFGNQKVRQEVMPYVASEVTYSHEFVSWDGIPIRAAWTDKNGKLNYQYNILPILDYASGVILGASMGHTENTDMFREAMQQAFSFTEGRKFRYTISDSGSAFTSYEGARIIQMVSEQHDFVKDVHSSLTSFGKSANKNPAERLALMIQMRFRDKPWFGGLGIKTKTQTLNSDVWNPAGNESDRLKYTITESELRKEIASVLAEFASEILDGKTALDWYKENIHPQAGHLLAWESNYAFGDIVTSPINVKKGLVRFNNEDYLISDYDSLIESGILVDGKARIRYNPANTSTIDLWSIGNVKNKKDFGKDKYIGTYGLRTKTKKSPLEQTSESWAAYHEQMNVVENTANKIVAMETQDKETFEEIMNGEFQIENEMRARYPFSTSTNKRMHHEATQNMMEDHYKYGDGKLKMAVGAEFSYEEEEPKEKSKKITKKRFR